MSSAVAGPAWGTSHGSTRWGWAGGAGFLSQSNIAQPLRDPAAASRIGHPVRL